MTVLYNLSNEPWMKYNMAAIADRGLKPSQWTSARFQTQVLLVETTRYGFAPSCCWSQTPFSSAIFSPCSPPVNQIYVLLEEQQGATTPQSSSSGIITEDGNPCLGFGLMPTPS